MTRSAPPAINLGRWMSVLLIFSVILFLLSGRVPEIMAALLPAQRRAAEYKAVLNKKDLARARALFDKDIKSAPADPTVYAMIASQCMAADQPELAIEYADRGVLPCKDAPAPDRALLEMILGSAYMKLEKQRPQEQAIKHAARAFELDPSSPEVLNLYGYVLAENERELDKAVSLLTQALQMMKKLPDTSDLRPLTAMIEDSYGWALYKQGNYDKAVAAINQAIYDLSEDHREDQAQNAAQMREIYYHLGAAYRRLKQFDQARNALHRSLTYDPKYSPAKEELDALIETPGVTSGKIPAQATGQAPAR